MERQVAIRTPLPPVRAPSTAATPPPAFTARGARVLGEQAYTQAMKTLVESHYFPDLRRLTAENAYLDAVATGDSEAIRTAAERLVQAEEQAGRIPPTPRPARRDSRTPSTSTLDMAGATPCGPLQRGWATPVDAEVADIEEEEADLLPPQEEALGDEQTTPLSSSELSQLTLDQFTKRFTSADNASFTEMMQRTNEERRHKYAWAFVEEHRSKRKFLAAREDEQQGAQKGRRLALTAGVTPRLIEGAQSSATKSQALVRSEDYKAVQKAPDTSPKVAEERTTPASWPLQARNNLMFAPPGLPASTYPSTGPQPSIVKGNTRLPDPEIDEEDVLETGSVLGMTPISATPRTEFSGDTPLRAESYPFLSPLPEPEPGAFGSSRLDQLLAWSAQQTPRNTSMEPSGATPRGFVPPPPSRREELANRLLASSTTPSRSHTRRTSRTPHTPRTRARTPRQALTPAGRNLLHRATDRTASPLARSLLGPRLMSARRRPGNQSWTPKR